jgi:murein L,D-transpeptidase YafK
MHRFFVFAVLACVQTVATADDSLPAYLIGLPDSVKTVYVAETSAAAFHRFENRAGQPIEYEGQTYMSIGEGGAGKQRTGDRRTPLGIYFVTEQLDTTRMHEKYGPMAFPLDYPDALDQRARRTGDGIWVHGVDARGGERPARDTDGCIALPNDALAKLEQTFRANVTPVIITRQVNWLNHEQLDVLRSELETALATWADSLRRGDVHAHVSLYDDDFRRWEMNKAEWTALMIETVGVRPVESVTISDVLLLGHPEKDGLYLSRFRQVITEAAGAAGVNRVESTRRLYWRRSESGGLKIIAEDAG